jgi:hypothetical protein
LQPAALRKAFFSETGGIELCLTIPVGRCNRQDTKRLDEQPKAANSRLILDDLDHASVMEDKSTIKFSKYQLLLTKH